MTEPEGAIPERWREAYEALEDHAPATPACAEPEEIWRAAAGDLSPQRARALVDHAAGCGACGAAWRLAREIRAEAGVAGIAIDAGRRPRPLSAPLAVAAAAVLALLAGGLWIALSPGGPERWRDVAVPKAAYEPSAAPGSELLWRGQGSRPSADPFAAAMEPYSRDDHAESERRLGAWLRSHPMDATARLYRGVSLLLLHRDEEAVRELQASRRLAPDSRASWYLALACLRTGRLPRAVELLGEVARSGGPEAAAAKRRLSDITTDAAPSPTE